LYVNIQEEILEEKKFLEKKAAQIRIDLLKMIYEANTGHTGGSLSCTDILTVLYYSIMKINPADPYWEDRDRFILSKGHSVEAYYCILADKGFFPREDLKTFCKFGSKLIGHPNNEVPGIEMNTGSLGHGLPIAVGMALAAKMDKKSWRVFVLTGDGELAEGTIWEGAIAAAHYNLDNLIAIVDRNNLQMSGNTEEVMKLEPLKEKWKSFGWEVMVVDGNDVEELKNALKSVPKIKNKPTVLIANTKKGKGVSFIEDMADWHHKVPTYEQLQQAIKELTEEN
jgi:transketolase